jgi:hypothetical protein
MLNEIVRDLHKRIEELRPASEEFSELLLAAEEFKKLGVEPASDPIEPVVANTLIYNTRYKRAIQFHEDGTWSCWTYKRKSDESYRFVKYVADEAAASLWLGKELRS